MGAARKRVLLAAPTSPIAQKILGEQFELISAEGLDDAELKQLLAGVDGIYAQAPSRITAEWIEAATKLEAIAVPGSGTNRIDLAAASAHGVAVVHAAGAAYQSVAEHAVGLMLALSKRIAYFDRYFHTHKEYPPAETGGYGRPLWGKTIGIVGLGFIGRDLARKCRLGFDMDVIAYDPYFLIFEARRQGIELLRDLDELMRRCDFLAITCPLNDETRDLIREPHLRKMKHTAYVIVSSRGGIVNEQDLVEALRQGWVAGAGVDTWDPEPPAPDHPFMSMENTVLTRHSAGGTAEDLDRLAEAAATQFVQALQGVRPDHIANPEVWPFGGERSPV